PPAKSRAGPAGGGAETGAPRKAPSGAVGGGEGGVGGAGGGAREPQGERGNSRRGRDARLDRGKALQPALGAGKRRARQVIARAGHDRRAVERRAATGDGQEQLVGYR